MSEINNLPDNITNKIRNAVWNYYIGSDKNESECFCGCGKRISRIELKGFECGHIIAKKFGGKAIIENLLPICSSCNSGMKTENLHKWCIDKGFKELRPDINPYTCVVHEEIMNEKIKKTKNDEIAEWKFNEFLENNFLIISPNDKRYLAYLKYLEHHYIYENARSIMNFLENSLIKKEIIKDAHIDINVPDIIFYSKLMLILKIKIIKRRGTSDMDYLFKKVDDMIMNISIKMEKEIFTNVHNSYNTLYDAEILDRYLRDCLCVIIWFKFL